MTYLLALDQGTTSSRAMLFDERAQVVGHAQRAFAQHFPRPGWVEHDADEIWHSQLACAHQVLAEAGVSAASVRALGITNQRETTVLWSRADGRPVAPAIVWQDRRTAARCDALRREGHAERIRAITGLELDAYFSATKLAWLLDAVPQARARAERGELAFGTVDCWLLWQLTEGGCHATDVSNASRTMLLNLETLDWDDALLALFDIPRAVLPQVVPSAGEIAQTAATVFGAAIPVCGMAGDQQAATFGQLCLRPGMAKNTYGTGCFLTAPVGSRPQSSAHRLLSSVAWQRAGETQYLMEGSVFMAGAIIQWLRDGLGLIREAGEVEALAASVADSGEVVLVPGFTGLGAPWWNPHARGMLTGMTRGTTAAHIARAALEAVALQSADLLDCLRADGVAVRELRVDGGMTRNNLLMQLQADLLGIPVVRPANVETTVLGAALLAGRAAGVWDSDAALADCWQSERVFEPQQGEDWRAAQRARWHAAMKLACSAAGA